jgi:hypothetical protein
MIPVAAILSTGVDIFKSLLAQDIAKKQLDLKAQEQHFQQSLSGLSNQQNFILNNQLANAKNDTDRLLILTDAVTKIKLQQQQSSTSSNNQKLYLIIAIAAIALIALIVVNRK